MSKTNIRPPMPKILLLLILILPFKAFRNSETNSSYVGATVCGECHSKQLKLWQGSHHDLAMQHATMKSVAGNFDNQTFKYFGVTSTFYQKENGFFVRTDGADGKLADFQIKYTLGFYPLQQYLIEFPGGRLQALGIAWDSRSKAEGGQRWFHLYPKDNVKAGETIHWTGIDQNWNHMCAECHSTHLQKNFDLANNRFNTLWSEINVSCEACHGAGLGHVAWAKQPKEQRKGDNRLLVKLTAANRPQWKLENIQNVAHPNKPISHRPETDLCARCHSRRSPISEANGALKPLLDTHIPELLTASNYYPDGRMQDEVYNYGSFLQSKMHQAGVSCNDCHEPHSLKLRAEGNKVCTQCHRESVYDTEKHHFHKTGTKGASCPECHMPASIYMVVDKRHDHGFRIPRPDLTAELGIPNVCNDCHIQKKPKWALDKITQFFGHPPGGYQDYASTLNQARTGHADALPNLVQLANNNSAPGIARATALWELRNYLSEDAVKTLQDALAQQDSVIRLGAVQTLSEAPNQLRPLLLDSVNDPLLSIRTLAAKGLATVPKESLSSTQQDGVKRASDEFIASQLLNADRPESHMNLGIFYSDAGNYNEAETAYRNALRLEPKFTQAYVNLADLMRIQNRDQDAEQLLRKAIERTPNLAEAHHALGLFLVRAKRMDDALGELEQASRLGGNNPHYGYVYAVALKNAGKTDKALQLLENIASNFPNNEEIIIALATFNQELGNQAKAMRYTEQLMKLRK